MFPAATARAILAGFEALGLDAEALRREAELDPDTLARLDGVFPTERFGDLWRAAFSRAPRDTLPAEVGLAIPFGAFGAVDYLAGSSANVAEGFRSLARDLGGLAPHFAVEVVEVGAEGLDAGASEGDGLVRLVWTVRAPFTPLSDQFILAACVGRFRLRSRGELGVRAVRLTGASPTGGPADPVALAAELSALFGAPVTLGCAEAALEIPRQSFHLALTGADPALQATLRALADHLQLGAPATDLEAAIRARLRALLPEGVPRAADLARSLGMSERTLQRRLAEGGSSYSDVLDGFRQAEAERLLAAEVPLSEVALRLGFADQTAWNRAFRRWKGMSPRQWRAQPDRSPSPPGGPTHGSRPRASASRARSARR